MADRLRVAAIQLNSGTEKADNIEKAERLVARAASTGADLVLLPEKWNAIGSADTLRRAAEPLEDGETVEAMREWARTHGITIVGGSITEQREGARSSRTRAWSSIRPATSSRPTARSTCSTSRSGARSIASRRPRSLGRRRTCATPRAGASG